MEAEELSVGKEFLALHAHLQGVTVDPSLTRCRTSRADFGGHVIYFLQDGGDPWHVWHVDEFHDDPAKHVMEMIMDEAAAENIRRADLYHELHNLMRRAGVRIDH